MQERLTIARPYAQAAFVIAHERGDVAAWAETLALLALVFKDPTMRDLTGNPRVSSAQVLEVAAAVVGDNLTDERQRFVEHLIDVDRILYLPEIAELFHRYQSEAEGSVDVVVTSAYPLDADQQNRIVEALRRRIRKTIELVCDTDRSLIGGAVIRINDNVIDLSVRGRLSQLAGKLI